MPEEREASLGPTITETNADVQAVVRDKADEPHLQKPRSNRGRASLRTLDAKAPSNRHKRHTEKERSDKLRLIAQRVANGSSTLKEAISQAGISEQTYYQWKRAAKTIDPASATAATAGDAFDELVLLEEENQRLRGELASKLRAENMELKRRLGLH